MKNIKKEDRKYGHCIYCGDKIGTRRLVRQPIDPLHRFLSNPPRKIEQWCGVMKGVCLIWTEEAEKKAKHITEIIENRDRITGWKPVKLSPVKMGILTGYTTELCEDNLINVAKMTLESLYPKWYKRLWRWLKRKIKREKQLWIVGDTKQAI